MPGITGPRGHTGLKVSRGKTSAKISNICRFKSKLLFAKLPRYLLINRARKETVVDMGRKVGEVNR